MDEPRFRAVLLHGFSNEEALAVMRAAKASCPSAADAAFATTTASNREWMVSDLMEHLEEEHESMRKLREGRTERA
jgi:predicted small metal-binding protein